MAWLLISLLVWLYFWYGVNNNTTTLTYPGTQEISLFNT